MPSGFSTTDRQIKVRVLFFGPVADATGRREEELELIAGSTAADVHSGLINNFPQLRGRSLKCAVDQQHCSWARVLADGEEVAIFTAVSGG